ncbi:hypothetical protein [Geomonas ferrireducens]|uniref:hypothetical protein n=1 Tax=Geomonas ferrireducens TaxID=2570227 RepID=UPI0010A8544B|nr:hypothetical protein [Geomonas ferrireducens]
MHDGTAFLASPPEGFPTDYLLARLKRRRHRLDVSQSPGIRERALTRETQSSPEVPQDGVREEYRWVYRQMNPCLRKRFAPYFLWFELRSILIALRHLRSGEKELADLSLAGSMLSPDVRVLFSSAAAPFADASPLIRILQAQVSEARQLAAWYREGKGREYERKMVSLYLEGVGREQLSPPVGLFFALLTDVKNLVALAKQLRWGVPDAAAFMDGGTIHRRLLCEELQKGGRELGQLLRKTLRRGTPESVPERVEHALLTHLTGRIRREARTRSGEAFILAYLWECHLRATNEALRFRAGSFGEEGLATELIA